MRLEKVEAATKESLPSEQFPEGNWGLITNGFQISLQLGESKFAVGEPIVATMLLRNTTTHALKYRCIAFMGIDGPIDFVVTTDSGSAVPSTAIKDAITFNGDLTLASHTQHKYRERLDKRFDLTNGIYNVSARYTVLGTNRFEIESAQVRIKIERE